MLNDDIFYSYYNNNINSLTLLRRALLYDIQSLSHRGVEFIYKKFNFFYCFFFFIISFVSLVNIYFNYIIIIIL